MWQGSITGRLVAGAALLLPLFLGASGLYLQDSHQRSLEAAEAERLQLQLFTLLAQAEYSGGVELPRQLIEARYHQPNSGLYAQVTDGSGERVWQSPSAITLEPGVFARAVIPLRPGQHHFQRLGSLYSLSWQVLWQTDQGEETPLQFTVLETAAPLDADMAVYRRGLLLWLGGSAALLLVCQALVLAWGLRPLRRLAEEVGAIEAGEAEQLGKDYPREIRPLTANLNTLLRGERQRRERVRNTLADLAHSLKTPLAVVRGANPAAADYNALVDEQVGRMEQIVHYQLQRASGGSHRLLQRVAVAPVLRRLCEGVRKVYAEKHLDLALEVAQDCRFRGDERDLMEIAGNLLDNACKYGRSRVSLRVTGGAPDGLRMVVEDDGPGIPAAERERILQRGTRLDEIRPGQGLGLAVTADIVASYRGELDIAEGAAGGARVVVSFP
ncbi:MAG: ATP-binding protein [Parahaliea sp.]